MLVCNIVSRPRRGAIAVDLIETAVASDANTIGNIVVAALVDAPASVTDRVDAYLGQLMAEIATATDNYSVGLLHAVSIDEPAAARDALAPRGPGVVIAGMVEAVTAIDTPNADVPVLTAQRVLCSSRAGLASAMVDDDGSGKTRVISNIGAVT